MATKQNSKFMVPLKPSAELAAVIGSDKPLPRTEVVKQIWVYIKKHDLQNPKNKREIVPDEKLSKVFETKEPVNMFKMGGLISKHLS